MALRVSDALHSFLPFFEIHLIARWHLFLWAVADVKTKFSGTIRAHATYGLEGRGRDGDAETGPGAGIKTPFCRGMRAKYLIL